MVKTYTKQALETFSNLFLGIVDMFKKTLVYIPYEVKLTGSLAIGTNVPEEKPDIDVFILTPFPVKAFQLAQVYFENGIEKKGELLIWHLPNYLGFPVDLVFENPDDLKTQTVHHTDYFQLNLSEKAKEDTIKFKRIAKKWNLYGAEVGGITGVACTMIAKHYDERRKTRNYLSSLKWYLYHYGFSNGAEKIKDPIVKDRILTANIADFKKERARFRLTDIFYPEKQELWKKQYGRKFSITPMLMLNTEFENRMTIHRKEEGTDREFQRIYSAVKKAINMFKHEYRPWNPEVIYDTFVFNSMTRLGYTVKTDELEPVWKRIPNEVVEGMDKDVRLKLTHQGKLTEVLQTDIPVFNYYYIHKNPHPDISPIHRFYQLLIEALG